MKNDLVSRAQTSLQTKVRKISSTKFPYLTALRPRQWTKNLVVFAAPIFALSMDWQSWLASLQAFVLFCGVSSAFYLLNDIADVQSDRKHPVKCQRPIAAGLVSIPQAIGMAAALLASTLIISCQKFPALGAVLIAYALLQIAYNFKLKHKPLVDIISIAMGFILRALAGAAAAGIELSSWFLICTAMLALFLGIEKRKAELRLSEVQGNKKTRAVLRRYTVPLLTRMESIVTTGMVMSYSIWSAGPLFQGASTSWMMLTLPFVFYGIFRYQLLSDPQEVLRKSRRDVSKQYFTERPEEVLLNDLPLALNLLGWVSMSIMILFLKQQGIIQ
ncbi:MAG: decaprenyl-phosphate phosphoribosyltransferase [Prochloraceae cyanobacterium]